MTLVRWDDRRYLIPVDKIVDFANSINAGFEPRTKAHGHFLLRNGDENKSAQGAPGIPQAYREYLLKEPII